MPQVIASLTAIPLFDAATIHGVRVVRSSLLGFQIDGRGEVLDAAEIAARIEAPRRLARSIRRPAPAQIAICARCGGDGLGRRNRGACGLCHGPGIQARLPWIDEANGAAPTAADVAAAIDQAVAAIRAAAYPRARESLIAILQKLLPSATAEKRDRAIAEVRRGGLEAAANALAFAMPAPRAA